MPPGPAYVAQQMWPRQGPDRPVVTPDGQYMPGPIFSESSPFRDGPPYGGDLAQPLPVTISTEEAMTGRLMFGVGVNSDAGLVGTISLDEQNFDWTPPPTSWEDIRNGTAWRGAGQQLQLQAMPGTQVAAVHGQLPAIRICSTRNVSLGLSGYYYTRIYNEYTDSGWAAGWRWATSSAPTSPAPLPTAARRSTSPIRSIRCCPPWPR